MNEVKLSKKTKLITKQILIFNSIDSSLRFSTIQLKVQKQREQGFLKQSDLRVLGSLDTRNQLKLYDSKLHLKPNLNLKKKKKKQIPKTIK